MRHLWTRLAGLGIVVSASLLLVSCSQASNSSVSQPSPAISDRSATKSPGTTSAATPAVAQGVERGIGDVPWGQVGSGWMLAVWTPVTPHRPGDLPAPGEPTREIATTVLYLVNPAGERYSITVFPPADGEKTLVDWSGARSAWLPSPDQSTRV